MPVYPHQSLDDVRRLQKRKAPHDYLGTSVGARRYVLETFGKSESAAMKRRVARFLVSTDCPACGGRRLRSIGETRHQRELCRASTDSIGQCATRALG